MDTVKKVVYVVLLVLYIGYLAWACNHNLQEATTLLILTGLVALCIVYVQIRDHHGETIWLNFGKPTVKFLSKLWRVTRWYGNETEFVFSREK